MKRTIITLVLCTLAQIIGFEIIEVPDVIKLPSLSAIMVLIASTIEERLRLSIAIPIIITLFLLIIVAGINLFKNPSLENMFVVSTCTCLWFVYTVIRFYPDDSR